MRVSGAPAAGADVAIGFIVNDGDDRGTATCPTATDGTCEVGFGRTRASSGTVKITSIVINGAEQPDEVTEDSLEWSAS